MNRKLYRPRILICEDEMMVAAHVAAIVEECGCEPVGPFATGREALSAIRRQAVDAAILDIDLSDGASTPLARALRQASVRMIVLSGLRTPSPPPEFAGVAWLDKPVDEARLQAFCNSTRALAAINYSVKHKPVAEPVAPFAI